MPRRTWTAGLFGILSLLLVATPGRALITRLTPLRDVLSESTFICTIKVESVDADKPALVLAVEEDLKGKSPMRKLAIALKGDAVAKKNQHVPQILKRIAPELPLLLFVHQRDKKYTALAYTNGTWFQAIGVEADGAVRWRFTHGEPYLRKTYKGSTADLKQIVLDGLSGKKKPPEPNDKEKPGFGPEVKKSEIRNPKSERNSKSEIPKSAQGPLFAVIPTVFVGGPLAILTMLFPAVFGGLMLVLRRWMAALSVLSINSTLYVAQGLCMRWLAGSWWGTPSALWLVMMVVDLLGLLWAWRRHLASRNEAAHLPGRVELLTLGILSIAGLVMAWFALPHTLSQLDLTGKTLWMFSVGLWMATLHALAQRWRAGRRSAAQAGLPGEGVLLWTMLLAGVGFSVTLPGESPSAGVSADDSEPYRVVWRFRPPVERCWIASSPAVDGERVYIGVVFPPPFGGGALYCIDRATGKQLWMFNDNGDMKDIFSSPCVADGRVYIGEGFHQDAECKLYCLDAATGKKIWDFATASHTESSPCVSAGKVYFGAGDDGMYCLDAATGKERWHLRGLHIDANPLVKGDRLYCGSGIGDAYKDTVLFCLDAESGVEQWRMPMDLPVWGQPAVADEYVYAGIGNGNFLQSADKPAGAVLCLKASTGQRIWRYDVGDGVLTRIAVDARNVYFGSRDHHCYSLDRADGRLRWKTDFGSPVSASPFLLDGEAGSVVYAIGSGGLLHHLDANTGRIEWTFDVAKDAGLPATAFSSPMVIVHPSQKVGSRLIYFGCGLNELTRGVLYCVEECRPTLN